MESAVEDRVKVKLFIGYLITSEIRMHLNQSNNWKQDNIAPERPTEALSEVHYQNKDYIGRFLTQDYLAMPQFKLVDQEMRRVLQSYCPNLNLDSLLTYTFPQIFVS